MKHEKLDKADKIILNILQENAKTPLKEIALKVYLSTPTVSAELKNGKGRDYYGLLCPGQSCGAGVSH